MLRDVIRFASGTITDSKGLFITSLAEVTPLLREVGIYAFADAGLAAVNVFAMYGDNLPGVQYYVGRENPSGDTLACLEAGYRDDAGTLLPNPFYNYPASYSSSRITLTYTNARWDAAYVDEPTGVREEPTLTWMAAVR